MKILVLVIFFCISAALEITQDTVVEEPGALLFESVHVSSAAFYSIFFPLVTTVSGDIQIGRDSVGTLSQFTILTSNTRKF